jgi:hypothetical protein
LHVEINELSERLEKSAFWLGYLDRARNPNGQIGIHVAIFSEPFLGFVLSGRKTVDSRFSRNCCAPFGEIEAGDIVLVKQVAGPVRGVALASDAWFFDLAKHSISSIRQRFGEAICADEAFWSSREDASFATLVALSEPVGIEPISLEKRDRRGWVSLRSRQMSLAL